MAQKRPSQELRGLPGRHDSGTGLPEEHSSCKQEIAAPWDEGEGGSKGTGDWGPVVRTRSGATVLSKH